MNKSILVAALILSACQSASEGNSAANESIANANSTDAGAVNVDQTAESPAEMSGADQGTGPAPVPPSAPTAPASRSDCPILDSSDWGAVVNAMPGPNTRPRLIVTGKVRTPTGGYTLAIQMGPVAESYPVQVTVRLQATPPDGPATQAIVTHDVRGSWPMSPPVGSVTVRCGSQVLKRISPVETVH